MSEKDRLIMVCDECLTASCWHGEFYCSAYRNAGVKLLPISTLQQLGREHPDNWSEETMIAVCGRADPYRSRQ